MTRPANGAALTRVHVLFESQDARTPNASSHIRLLRPLMHPANASRIALTSAAEMIEDPVDLVIVDRFWHGDLNLQRQAALLETLRRRRIPYLYSLDDNLLDLHTQPGQPASPSNTQRQIVRGFVTGSAGVLASTSPLADRLAGLGAPVTLLANQLDETLYSAGTLKPRRTDGSIVIGYMGTYSHLADLQLVLQPLRRVLARYQGRVRLEVVGIASPAELRGVFADLPVRIVEVPTASVPYTSFVPWMQSHLGWDFALAPLQDNRFNHSKSDIKLLDYGMLGIPGLFSAVPAYEHSLTHGVHGLLVPNDPVQWEASLERMIASTELRQSMAAAVYEHVHAARTLATHAPAWADAVEAVRSAPSPIHSLAPVRWSGSTLSETPEELVKPNAVPLTRNEKMLYYVDLDGAGLEIGPSFAPVVSKSGGFNVEILDHADQATLVAKYSASGVDTSRIEPVDYIWQGQPMDELTGRSNHYDYIVASHVIEHTPDLVAFLNQIESMLKVGGVLVLAVPDCRYCFDVLRGVTTCGDVLQAHFEGRKRHTPGTIYDHFATIVFQDGKPSWGPDVNGTLAFLHTVDEAWTMVEQVRRTPEYVDVHNWRFTPASFKFILSDLHRLGLVSLVEKVTFGSDGNEFYVTLEKCGAAPLADVDRLRLAVEARHELSAVM